MSHEDSCYEGKMSYRGTRLNCQHGVKQDISYYKFIGVTKDGCGQEYALYELVTEYVLWIPYLLSPSSSSAPTEKPLDLSQEKQL